MRKKSSSWTRALHVGDFRARIGLASYLWTRCTHLINKDWSCDPHHLPWRQTQGQLSTSKNRMCTQHCLGKVFGLLGMFTPISNMCPTCEGDLQAKISLVSLLWTCCTHSVNKDWSCCPHCLQWKQTRISPHCDLDIENREPIFLHDTLPYDTIPGLATECSVVQKISSGQTFTNIFNFRCDLDLECSNLIFPQDTLAYDAVLSNQVCLQTDQQFSRYSKK